MVVKDKPTAIYLNILKLSCLIYTPLSFLINLLCALIANGQLLSLLANALLFLFSFIFSLILVLKKKTKDTHKTILYSTCFYTVISFIINALVLIMQDGRMWTLWSIILILSFSVVTSILLVFLKINNYLVSSVIYYAVSLASFMLLTVLIADYREKNYTMIIFGVFTIVYVVSAIIYFFIKKSFSRIENEEKEYKRQFD